MASSTTKATEPMAPSQQQQQQAQQPPEQQPSSPTTEPPPSKPPPPPPPAAAPQCQPAKSTQDVADENAPPPPPTNPAALLHSVNTAPNAGRPLPPSGHRSPDRRRKQSAAAKIGSGVAGDGSRAGGGGSANKKHRQHQHQQQKPPAPVIPPPPAPVPADASAVPASEAADGTIAKDGTEEGGTAADTAADDTPAQGGGGGGSWADAAAALLAGGISGTVGEAQNDGPPPPRKIGRLNIATNHAAAAGAAGGGGGGGEGSNLTPAAAARQAELENLRRKGLAKIFNRHFTTTAESISRERAAAEAALREMERRREEMKNRPTPNSEGGREVHLSQLEALTLELRRRRDLVRKKERETQELYRRYVCQYGEGSGGAPSSSAGVSAGGGGDGPVGGHGFNPAAFFQSVNTAPNAGVPLGSSQASHVGMASGYTGQHGGLIVSPSSPARRHGYNRNSSRRLPSVGENGEVTSAGEAGADGDEDGCVEEQHEDVVRQADLLMSKLMEKTTYTTVGEATNFDVQPKSAVIESSVEALKSKGSDILPDGIQQGREYAPPKLGSIHSVMQEGGEGQSILVTRSGGVLVKDVLGDGESADVRNGDVNWTNYGNRGRVPLDADEYAAIVTELNREKKAREEELIAPPTKGVWKKQPSLGSGGGLDEDGGKSRIDDTTAVAKLVPPPEGRTRDDDVMAKDGLVKGEVDALNARGLPSSSPTDDARAVNDSFNLDLDDLSALTSCDDLTKDDLTVATTTLYNFLKTETENIRRMFEEADAGDYQQQQAGLGGDGSSLAGGTVTSSSDVRSVESETLNAATRAAEEMVKQMAVASRWMSDPGETESDSDDDDGEGARSNSDASGGSDAGGGSWVKPLYAIHQDASLGLGNLPEGIVAAAGSSWITWNAYYSEEHGREYYHEPASGTTTWTKPVGVRVETAETSEEEDEDQQALGSVHSNSSTKVGGVTSTTGSRTHCSNDFQDEIVEVKDFTKTTPAHSTRSTIDHSKRWRGRSRSPGGQSVVSEVTFDDGGSTPESDRSMAALRSADGFRPDLMSRGGRGGGSTRSLAEYRARQRRNRRRRRRRALLVVLASLLLVVALLGWRGTVIVPYLNEVSGGALGRGMAPILEWIDDSVSGVVLGGREVKLMEWAEDVGLVGNAAGSKERTPQKEERRGVSPVLSSPPEVSLRTGGATRAASPSAALKSTNYGGGSGGTPSTTIGARTAAKEDMEGMLSGAFKRESTAAIGRAVSAGIKDLPSRRRSVSGAAEESPAAATKAVAIPGGKKNTSNVAELPRQRYRLCNIPFAYVFIRRCWKESREFPINVGWLMDAMMQ